MSTGPRCTWRLFARCLRQRGPKHRRQPANPSTPHSVTPHSVTTELRPSDQLAPQGRIAAQRMLEHVRTAHLNEVRCRRRVEPSRNADVHERLAVRATHASTPRSLFSRGDWICSGTLAVTAEWSGRCRRSRPVRFPRRTINSADRGQAIAVLRCPEQLLRPDRPSRRRTRLPRPGDAAMRAPRATPTKPPLALRLRGATAPAIAPPFPPKSSSLPPRLCRVSSPSAPAPCVQSVDPPTPQTPRGDPRAPATSTSRPARWPPAGDPPASRLCSKPVTARIRLPARQIVHRDVPLVKQQRVLRRLAGRQHRGWVSDSRKHTANLCNDRHCHSQGSPKIALQRRATLSRNLNRPCYRRNV